MRVLEIAEKLTFIENSGLVKDLPTFIRESKVYAEEWSKIYNGFVVEEKYLKGYRLKYLLGKICPKLYNFEKMPMAVHVDIIDKWYMEDEGFKNIYSEDMRRYLMENSYAEFKDVDGSILQEGVKFNEEEYDAFMSFVKRIN